MIKTAFAFLALQAAPYQTGEASRPTPAYQAAPATYNVAPAVGPIPELARTGVLIDAYDRRVEARWGTDDPFYAATVRGGAAAAQSRQGELDGGWVVAGPDGEALYSLQLADAGEGVVDGAWRAAPSAGAGGPARSGFIALIGREGGRVVFRFLEPGETAPTVLSLNQTADGFWRGELTRSETPVGPAIMRRR